MWNIFLWKVHSDGVPTSKISEDISHTNHTNDKYIDIIMYKLVYIVNNNHNEHLTTGNIDDSNVNNLKEDDYGIEDCFKCKINSCWVNNE